MGSLLSGNGHALAQPQLELLFADHAVLQRGRPIPIWGEAVPGSSVKIRLAGKEAAAQADAAGKWKTTLPALPAGGPFEISVSDGSGQVVSKDVMVGDVWLCAGQSNMAFRLKEAMGADLDLAAADLPAIRHFNVEPKASTKPLDRLDTAVQKQGWVVSKPQSAGEFSAVAFYFARELNRQTGVPIGLVTAAWGGTPIQAWTDPEQLRDLPSAKRAFDDLDKIVAKMQANSTLAVNGPEVLLQNRLGADYHGMIHPLAPFSFCGVLWYQGEQNAGAGRSDYTEVLKRMIAGWRRDFGNEALPFYWVQLPNFTDRYEGAWPQTREALLYGLRIPNTGMATAIDQGESFDIHPRCKSEVGRRLARVALAKLYGKPIVYSGPVYCGMQIEGAGIRLDFAHQGGGMISKDRGELREFQIAGEDQKFVEAKAIIEKGTVFVWSNEVPQPKSVRYAWKNNPNVNFFNREGLPAVPFRTDGWPLRDQSDWSLPDTLKDPSPAKAP